MRRCMLAVLLALAAPAAARADGGSLYSGPAPRPGPDILYAPAADAPQLTNAGIWRAAPILVSGATAYRDGEFLYQDFLYDDHGARFARDPGDPRTAGDTFSQPNGTSTYPTDPVYAGNAADLVELRVKPLADATAFRLTLNTMLDPERMAATIAIGGSPGSVPVPFPYGANASAPAEHFLTVHGSAGDFDGAPLPASVDLARRQLEVRVPHSAWDPGRGTVRLAAGVGLWDAADGRYLVPEHAATASTPGGGLDPTHPGTAFFNVAFRANEPLPGVRDVAGTSASPAWWRDRAQGEALRDGDLTPFHAEVDFGKLAEGTDDDSAVPKTGVLNRILASRFEPAQGTDFSTTCVSTTACEGEYRGRLQPYALYVPPKPPPGGRYGLQLLLHSQRANYNQFSGSRNQSQFGDRGQGHLVMTAEGRGPDGWYYDKAGADTFEVWADVARRYPLDPALTSVAGYSMGGYATYKLATQFPDLFARGQPTVGPPALGTWIPPIPPAPGGERSNTFNQLASLRNVPFLMWVANQDELVPYPSAQRQAQGFDDLGYRYELDTFAPAEHLTLAVNDQYAPAAAFLGDARVDRDPPHVTFVRNPTMDFAADGTTADHAYWLSGIALRDAGGDAPRGFVGARSSGFGVGDAPAGPTQTGLGALDGGTFGSIPFTSQSRAWGAAPAPPPADALALTLRNVRTATIHPARARISCAAKLTIDTDGPASVTLDGCGRTEQLAGAGVFVRPEPCAQAAALARVSATPRGRSVRISFKRLVIRGVTVDILRHSKGRHILGAKRVARFLGVREPFTWKAAKAGDGYYTVRLRLLGDDRRLVLERRKRRFHPRPGYAKRPSCDAIPHFALGSPVFGGTRGRSLAVSFATAKGATARLELLRGRRVLRRLAASGGRTRVSARGLKRATYRVRLTVRTANGKSARATLSARRL